MTNGWIEVNTCAGSPTIRTRGLQQYDNTYEDTMKTTKRFITMALLLPLLTCLQVLAQNSGADRITVPLSDPNKPAFLKVGILSGSIKVVGSASKDVVVEAQIRKEDDNNDGDEEEQARRKARSGLRLIPNTSTGLTVEEDDNVVSISTGSRGGSRTIDLTIQVPSQTSVKLSTVNDGDIEVSRLNGDFEVNNTNGNVTMKDISGSAVAHALNGFIHTNFLTINPAKSMSFSSLNGEVDVTFPASLKATLSMKSEQGEIYSDFDIAMENSTTKIDEDGGKGKGRYHVSLERGMKGKINGGGQEITFKNFNGDIYIRKAK